MINCAHLYLWRSQRSTIDFEARRFGHTDFVFWQRNDSTHIANVARERTACKMGRYLVYLSISSLFELWVFVRHRIVKTTPTPTLHKLNAIANIFLGS